MERLRAPAHHPLQARDQAVSSALSPQPQACHQQFRKTSPSGEEMLAEAPDGPVSMVLPRPAALCPVICFTRNVLPAASSRSELRAA